MRLRTALLPSGGGYIINAHRKVSCGGIAGNGVVSLSMGDCRSGRSRLSGEPCQTAFEILLKLHHVMIWISARPCEECRLAL